MVSVNFNTRGEKDNTRQVTGIIVLIVLLIIFWIDMFYNNNNNSSSPLPGSMSTSNVDENENTTTSTKEQQQQQQQPLPRMKILYIITSSNEYNTGDKKTIKGQDRLKEIMLPVILDGVESINSDYDIDVYLILGYTLSQERYQMIQDLLPNGVGLEVWDDATPLNYDYINKKSRTPFLDNMPRALARQHRYVIKDKLPYYDFFLAFEDDMLIKKSHINYYVQFMNDIDLCKKQQLILKKQKQQDTTKTNSVDEDDIYNTDNWFDKSSLTIEQLDYIKPGFLRVEVMTSPERQIQVDNTGGPIEINKRARPDPRICCHTTHVGLNGKLGAPQYPTADQLLVWETAIQALFVRPFDLNLMSNNKNYNNMDNWVAILPIKGTPNKLQGYWSGTGGTLESIGYGRKKPKSILNEYIGQSAGWMMSRKEIIDMDRKLCHSGFLPPYDQPLIQEDGMGFMTDSVEYWSGGLQLWGQLCGIQRIINLNPFKFSHHLIYHTANNKQIEIQPKERLIKITTLLGQLHTVKNSAIKEMNQLKKQQQKRNNNNNNPSFITKILRLIGI